MKKTWLVEISQGSWTYVGLMEIVADKIEWDWSDENFREEWALEPGVGNVLTADGVKITFDEPFRKPKLKLEATRD